MNMRACKCVKMETYNFQLPSVAHERLRSSSLKKNNVISQTVPVVLPMIHKRTVIGPVLRYGHFGQGFKRRIRLETILGRKAGLGVATHIPTIHLIVIKVHWKAMK